MGGSLSKDEADSETGGNFDQNVWGGQSPALEQLYSNIGNLFNLSTDGMQGQIPGAVRTAQSITDTANPYWQDQMQGGAYQDVNPNDIMDNLSASMNTPSATQQINSMIMGGEGNNYADAMRDQYIKDANDATQNMLKNTDARATASMMSGGARHGVSEAKGFEDINDNLQRNLAITGYETFDKDLDRKLGIASQADYNTLARQGMMQDMLAGKQNAMSGGLGYGANMQGLNMGQFAPYMAPWQSVPSYTSAIGAPTILSSGSNFGNSSSKGKGGEGYINPD